jgi:hypothetical protein
MSDIEYNDGKKQTGEDSDISDLSNELKNLPRLVVPDNFEYNLKVRILNTEPKRKTGWLDRLFFPSGDAGSRRIIFSTVTVLVCCSVILGYLVVRHFNNMNSQNTNSLDSTYFEGKKVIILPPTAPPQSDKTAEQPLHKYIEQKSTRMDEETLRKYIIPSAPSKEEMKTGVSDSKPAPDSSIKSPVSTKEVGGLKINKGAKSKIKDTQPKK